jgi:hypothetical protein
MQMQNRWTVEKEPVIGWMARLPADWHREVLSAGEETGVYRVVKAPSLGYERKVDGAFTDFLAAGGFRDGPLRVDRAISGATSRLAFADPAGAILEDDVVDLAAVLTAAPHAAPAVNREPLRLSAFPSDDGGDSGVALLVSSYSDIWLPWCSARFEEGAHIGDLADNRELARRHAPRLNEFLATLGDLAQRTGGTLAVWEDNTSPNLAFQVGDRGVLLDVSNPQERVVWERFGGQGSGDLLEALRRAAERAAHEPPPAPFRAAIGAWTDDSTHVLYDADRGAVLDFLRASGRASAALDGAKLASIKVQMGSRRHAFDVAEWLT